MRILILLMLIAACTYPPKEPEQKPSEEKTQEVQEEPKKKPAQKPTVIVVPAPAPKLSCPPPAQTDKQQVMQNLDCVYQKIEKIKPK